MVVLFPYIGSSLKSFIEPSSANMENFSAGESSQARDAFRPAPLWDGTISLDLKMAVDLDKFLEAISRKQGINKKLRANVEGDKKDAPITCLPQNAKDAPIKSQEFTKPPATNDLENSGKFKGQGQQWHRSDPLVAKDLHIQIGVPTTCSMKQAWNSIVQKRYQMWKPSLLGRSFQWSQR